MFFQNARRSFDIPRIPEQERDHDECADDAGDDR
jgi:hypothetical protein